MLNWLRFWGGLMGVGLFLVFLRVETLLAYDPALLTNPWCAVWKGNTVNTRTRLYTTPGDSAGSTGVTISYRGPGHVHLWMSNPDGSPVVGLPGPYTDKTYTDYYADGRHSYFLNGCDDSSGSVCGQTINVTTAYPAGVYSIYCDNVIAQDWDGGRKACSSIPFCDYSPQSVNSGGGGYDQPRFSASCSSGTQQLYDNGGPAVLAYPGVFQGYCSNQNAVNASFGDTPSTVTLVVAPVITSGLHDCSTPNGSTKNTLQFTPRGNFVGYQLLRDGAPVIGFDPNSTSFVDTPGDYQTLHTYTIQAIGIDGSAVTSNSWPLQGYCTPNVSPPNDPSLDFVYNSCSVAAGIQPTVGMQWSNTDYPQNYYLKVLRMDQVNQVATRWVRRPDSGELITYYNDTTITSQQTDPNVGTEYVHNVDNLVSYDYQLSVIRNDGSEPGYSQVRNVVANCCPVAQACPTACHTDVQYVDNGLCGKTACQPTNSGVGVCPVYCGYPGGTVSNGTCGTKACPQILSGCLCTSPPNNCGETAQGSTLADGSCSAVTPVCPAPVITNVSNASCNGAGTVSWTGKSGLFNGSYGYSVDLSDSPTFTTVYSKWIAAPMGTTSGSTTLPTDIDWQGYGFVRGTYYALPGGRTWYVRVWNGSLSNSTVYDTQTCVPTLDFKILFGGTVATANTSVQIVDGNSATLVWNSTNATTCSASGSWNGTKATSSSGENTGILTVGTKNYTLSCSRGSTTVVKNITVYVNRAAFIKTTGGNVHSNENIVTPGQ